MDLLNAKPSNISKGSWMVLVGIGIFIDLLQIPATLVPFLPEFLNALFFAIVWLVFAMNGERYSKVTLIGGFIFGLIPGLDMLPEATATVMKLYFDAKARNVATKIEPVNNMTKFRSRSNITRQTQREDEDTSMEA